MRPTCSGRETLVESNENSSKFSTLNSLCERRKSKLPLNKLPNLLVLESSRRNLYPFNSACKSAPVVLLPPAGDTTRGLSTTNNVLLRTSERLIRYRPPCLRPDGTNHNPLRPHGLLDRPLRIPHPHVLLRNITPSTFIPNHPLPSRRVGNTLWMVSRFLRLLLLLPHHPQPHL